MYIFFPNQWLLIDIFLGKDLKVFTEQTPAYPRDTHDLYICWRHFLMPAFNQHITILPNIYQIIIIANEQVKLIIEHNINSIRCKHWKHTSMGYQHSKP